MSKTENIIEIKGLNVIYNKGKANQVRALENVNLVFKKEEWIIIFGPSGCGKSTLLNSIASFQTPNSGNVKVLGKNVHKLSSNEKSEYRRKSVGMVFQSFHLVNSLRVLDNVCLPQVFFGVNLKKREAQAKELLNRFGIGKQANRYPPNISGGQRQRVSIARALMNKPEIILADEPVGNLDSKATYNVMAIFKELNKVDKKTIIMVTHDRYHLKYADRVVYVKDGRVLRVEVNKKIQFRVEKGEELKGEIGKKKTTVKDVQIPVDLRLLMNSFQDLSSPSIGRLLTPFKVRQAFSHLMLPITDYQVKLTQQYMKDFFLDKINKKQFFDQLNQPTEEGGAGWDKRNVEKFVDEIVNFHKQAQQIDYSEPYKSSLKLSRFLSKRYSIGKTEYKVNILKSGIENRINNEISKDKFQEILSRAVADEGLGLNKRTAEKVARELELIILLRYST